jgi:predicted enzyme related to lactoylglutathione lyase
MIGGLHTILYSEKAEAVWAFFREVLEFPSVDAGHGWLIFAAPPSELAVHPAEERAYPDLYLMCDDIKREVARLESKGVKFTMPISEQRWGLLTRLTLPDGQTLGLYEPRHPMAIRMSITGRPESKKPPAKRKQAATRNARRRKNGRY